MNKQQEALRLALEALEAAYARLVTKCEQNLVTYNGVDVDTLTLSQEAITAIREALADSALDRMAENARELGLDYEPPCKTGSQCTSKCQQCEQPAQQEIEELTAQRDWLADILTRTANALKGQPAELSQHSWHDLPEVAQQLKAAQQQEPMVTKNKSGITLHVGWDDLPVGTKLYTSTPASKPWVGLTAEDKAEIENIVGITEDDDGWMVSQMFTLTEAKLREKNT